MMRRRLPGGATVARPGALAMGTQMRSQSQDTANMGPQQRNTYKDMTDPCSGQQMSFLEPPDMTEVMGFQTNTLEHVKVPELSLERRSMSDIEKEKEMRAKYGEFGPGERMDKTIQQLKKQELDKQQDIDGLPWEVRWRKSLIPTQEEVIQDIRDKYDIWVQDPIEREEQWFLHWKDRGMKSQKDRMVWPQGYTDYLDHYDEDGRRRTLPTDQRWSDTTWKHLADTKYRDRMWMVETEERKAVQKSTEDAETLMLEYDKSFTEQADVWNGITQGVIDIDPDQAYQALTGTADPMEVAKTKFKVHEYQAEQAMKFGKKQELDPITGFPKSDRPPLPSGLTVEQAAAIESKVTGVNEQLEERVTAHHDAGKNPWVQLGKEHLELSERAEVEGRPQPGLRHLTEVAKDKVLKASEAYHTELEGKKEHTPSLEDGTSSPPVVTPETKHATMAVGMHKLEEELRETLVTPTAPSTDTSSKKSQAKNREEGFIEVPGRPEGEQARVATSQFDAPSLPEIEDDLPEWYRKSLIEPGPMIQKYGIVGDPLETETLDVTYRMKPKRSVEETLVTSDIITQGENVFDEGKLYKQRATPEFATGDMKPLPLFREAKKPTDQGKEVTKQPRSQKLAAERAARQKRMIYDPDLMLPDLPFETDSIADPYRGVIESDTMKFDKKEVEKVYLAYKEFLQQRLVEFSNIVQATTEDRSEMFLRDAIQKVREGDVGSRPTIDQKMEDVFKISFEGHLKQFLSDWLKFHASRKPEAEALKGEADDLMRKATAKTKQCGKAFMEFMQEMTAIEMDRIKKNPVQRYTIMVREKKHEVLAKPFIKWISSELGPFIKNNFLSFEQLEQHREMLNRHLNDAKHKCPMRVEGVQDKMRDCVVEAFYYWCRGALLYYCARHFFDMYLRYAESRFKMRAEDQWEESYEVFQAFHKASKESTVYIPLPHSEPMYEFQDSDYLEGENGYHAEITGDLERAERIWHTGTTLRWYPVQDETDYVLYFERRGRITQAFDCSDRCLDALNKKTHPSVHPFPERAKKFLEGAPLSQETSEHLWLRYMGDVYVEHADFHNRCGKAQTGRDYLDQALNYYHIALRTAEERLPKTWSAPLLTKAKMLCRSLQNNTDVEKYVVEVKQCVDEMYALGEEKTVHWMDRFTDFPYRVSLLIYASPAFLYHAAMEAQELSRRELNTQSIAQILDSRARQHKTPDQFDAFEDAVDKTGMKWRNLVMGYRAKEKEKTDAWHLLTHFYFLLRVRPHTPEEVDKYKEMYWSTYDYFYTQTALGVRSRSRMFHDVIRKLCQILIPGSKEQREFLLEELEKIDEKMRHATNGEELDRTIRALELNLKDPRKPPYVYGSETLRQRAMDLQQKFDNPLLQVSHGRPDYDRMRAELKNIRENVPMSPPPTPSSEDRAPGQSGPIGGSDADIGASAPTSGREILERQNYGVTP